MVLEKEINDEVKEIIKTYKEFKKKNYLIISELQFEQQRKCYFNHLRLVEENLDSSLYHLLLQLLVINEIYISMLKGELD